MSLLIQLRDLKESGHLKTVTDFETQVLTNLLQRLGSTSTTDHIEFVRVRGMLDGIRHLQSVRDNILEEAISESRLSS